MKLVQDNIGREREYLVIVPCRAVPCRAKEIRNPAINSHFIVLLPSMCACVCGYVYVVIWFDTENFYTSFSERFLYVMGREKAFKGGLGVPRERN